MKNLATQLSTKLVDFIYQYDKGQVVAAGTDVAVNWTSLPGFFESLDINLHDIEGFQMRFKDMIVQSYGTETVKPIITIAQLISLLEHDVDNHGNSSLEILHEKLEGITNQRVNSPPSKVCLPIRS